MGILGGPFIGGGAVDAGEGESESKCVQHSAAARDQRECVQPQRRISDNDMRSMLDAGDCARSSSQ